MKKESKPLHKLELKELNSKVGNAYQKIACPSCDHAIPAEDINIQDKIAKCGGCNAVFPFTLKIEALLNATPPAPPKQTVLRPAGVDMYAYQDELEIVVQQPISVVDFLPWTIFPIMPILFTVLSLNASDFPIPLFVSLATWLIGIYPIMNAINFKKHKIYMNMDDVYFNIEWRPKKFHKDKRILVKDIDQVYLKENAEGYHQVTMIVNEVTGQKHIKLMALKSLSQARYLEQEIERYLKITDRSIPEEYKV